MVDFALNVSYELLQCSQKSTLHFKSKVMVPMQKVIITTHFQGTKNLFFCIGNSSTLSVISHASLTVQQLYFYVFLFFYFVIHGENLAKRHGAQGKGQ